MTAITQSYDDAVYKLVPNADALVGFSERAAVIINEFLEETPRDLPGVVTHSGEAEAYLGVNRVPLYTHADPAEVEELRLRVAQLVAEVNRYQSGMANWKDAAEEKDRQFVAQLEESVERRMAALVSWNHWRERAEEAEAQLAQQDGALDTYLTNNYPAAVGDSVSARAINALETMDVQLGMKSAQQDGAQPVAWRATNFSNDGNDYAYRDADDQFVNPSGESVGQALYTHADPAEVAALRQRVADLECMLEDTKPTLKEQENITDDITKQRNKLEAQLAQQDVAVPKRIPAEEIGSILNEVMEQAVAHGANSISMPDEYVAVAHFLSYPEEYAHPATQPTPEDVVKAALEAAKTVCHNLFTWSVNNNYSIASQEALQAAESKIDALDHATIIQAAKDGK